MRVKRSWLSLVIVALLLEACTPAASCGPVPLHPTATPRVSRPTAAASRLTLTAAATQCPIVTIPPTVTPVLPTRAAPSRGLGLQGGAVRGITTTPQNETLLGAVAGEGWTALVYRDDERGELYVSTGDTARIGIGPGEAAAVAFGPDQVAVLTVSADTLNLRLATTLWAFDEMTRTISLPWTGTDLATGYGPEGWLYVAAGGRAERFNPFDEQWESALTYAGMAQQIARTSTGALLLQSTTGVYRRDPTSGEWARTWSGNADGMAVLGERVALTWQAGNAWHIVTSTDSGTSWSAVETAAEDLPGTLGSAYPVLAADGVIEIVGLYTEPARSDGSARYALPILAQRGPHGWFPAPGDHPEPLSAQTAELRPVRRLNAVSSQGLTLIAWEGIQFNGAGDVFAVSR